jgi:glycosyltransferase involved in cell wall biosynthesis
MRVVLLADRIPPYEVGGGGKIPWLLALGLRDLGHEVVIISSTPDASYEEVRQAIPIHYLHSAYPARWRAWLSLHNPATVGAVKRLLEQLQPDVVNAHNIHTHLSYASLKVAQQLGFPVVFSSHDVMPFAYGKIDYFVQQGCNSAEQAYRLPWGHNLRENRLRYNPLRNRIIRQYLTRYTHVRTAVSQAHRRALEANDLPSFEVAYHGFEPAPSLPSTRVAELRQRFGLEDRKVILVGGRLSPAKGNRQLLQALDQLVQSIPNLTLLILSNTPLEKALWADLPHLTESHIREAGWLSGEELWMAFALAELVCVPSIIFDAQPTVTYEAMAAAKPAIVTCFGGARELVLEGVTGYVVNPFETDLLAQRLHQLLTQPEQAQAMGQAALAHLQRHYSTQHYLERMLNLYAQAQAQIRLAVPSQR